MERLSGLDSAFLAFESPSMHLHMAVVALVDPATASAPVDAGALGATVVRRLLAQPAFRRRVVEAPFRLDHPVWVEDPDLDPGAHVHHRLLPPPGGLDQLAAVAAEVVSRPLDRSRPLWEVHVVDGLGDGRVALVAKVHHAVADGASAIALLAHLFDEAVPLPGARAVDGGRAGGGAAPPAEPPGGTVPSDAEMLGHVLVAQARRATELPGLVGRTLAAAARLAVRHRDAGDEAGAVPLHAPRTPWTAAVTPRRSVAFARVSLGDVRRVGAAWDATVNDVVLALVAAVLRQYLLARAALPEEPLVAMCPVSTRGGGGTGGGANQVSAMFVRLRTDLADPVERLRATARSAHAARQDHDAVGGDLVATWAGQVLPGPVALAARLYARVGAAAWHPPLHDVVVSDVRGPDAPLHLDGARLVAAYPLGPVMDGAGLNVTALSSPGHVHLGFVADAHLVPDPWQMADAVAGAMGDLRDAVDDLAAPGAGGGPRRAVDPGAG